MNTTPTKTCVPQSSAIAAYLPGAYFHDSWSIAAEDPSPSALGQFLRALLATPSWVNQLMSIRNNAVSALGLKNLGTLSQIDQAKAASAYQPGDRVGIFTLIVNTTDEVLLGDKDKHLDVVLSVHKAVEEKSGQMLVTVTTVVHVHNWLGRLYMLPVTPMHRIIAPTVLKAVGPARHAA
ncbi:MAG TPA: DUF2867 domain-containing protein [Paucimonas sp.]|nr:DUF2867 domain-containing protein [Paucimonas sp.]